MGDLRIHWKIKRLDHGEEPDVRIAECLLEISGRIECDGQTAGILEANYLFSKDPESIAAFMDLWDLDAATCEIYEEILDRGLDQFRYPIPWLIDSVTGFLCIHYLALRPAFRGIGLGPAVMRELVRSCADSRTGVVLLDVRPLQHRPNGYDHFDEEVRDLPWNRPEQDSVRLVRHFTGWGMEHLPGSRFMVAAPVLLSGDLSPAWPPCPILDQWNTCAACGGWIDLQGSAWEETDDGPYHSSCK